MSEGEKPRVEPEIIPPDHDARNHGAHRPDPWMHRDSFDRTHHIYVTRVGPFGGLWLMLGIAALSVAVLLLVFGAFVILAPLLVALVVGGIIVRWWRGDFRGHPWS